MPTFYLFSSTRFITSLSYDVASGSEITPYNKIDKPLVVYRFSGNVMTSITTLRTYTQNINVSTSERDFKVILIAYDKKNLTFLLLYYLIY